MSRVWLITFLLLPLSALAAPDFSRDVLPILSDTCFACHGPDANARKAKLRLDVEADAKQEVIVPGKSAESELIARIFSTDPDELMPPPESKIKLTAAQKATLKAWIDAGAKWGKHWAYESPKPVALPKVQWEDWPRDGLDAFILARLEREGLPPSKAADRITWLRRVTLDLTGLPPTLAEVDAFQKDQTPKAFEKVVDRLLASPRYGERMAWDWLEAAALAAPDFSRDVLPILSDTCFACHGPDANARKAKLRLDVEADAKQEVIVPGKSAESELIARIFSTDPDELMPPPESKIKLTAAQKATLKAWIDAGAKWGKHWAYESPKPVALPKVQWEDWPRDGLDAFILARLEREGLPPSKAADRITWLRRAAIDLV